MAYSYCIGIDLGTSNSAISIVKSGSTEAPESIAIPQSQAASAVVALPLLPSSLYIPTETEAREKAFQLPWGEQPIVVGQFAKEQEARTPERVVRSAKSWLCNNQIDRRQPMLPWEAPSSVKQLSPVEATETILRHVAATLKDWFEQQGDPGGLASAMVVVTVPASFDETARQLTYEAAKAALLPECVLLEEPLAAFYAWLAENEQMWRSQVKPGDLLLVCDVGGGTADFSLIGVTEEAGNLGLTRVSVGEHILLGGDNMDLALAYKAREMLPPGKARLDSWQMGTLVYAAQQAKERLLSDASLDQFPITIPHRGANLFATPLQVSLSRAVAEQSVIEGFFPLVGSEDAPYEAEDNGLQEFQLPYAADAAITKHLAAFLRSSAQVLAGVPEYAAFGITKKQTVIAPSAILFNGGVFNSPAIRERISLQLKQWFPKKEVVLLTGIDRSRAVAQGAACYARTKASGTGFRVRSATTRSFYIGIESSGPAVPGYIPPTKGLCIAPRGVEEGNDIALPKRTFSLKVGDKVSFKLFSSAHRESDLPGQEVADATIDLDELQMLTTTIHSQRVEKGTRIPVTIHTTLSELGLLEITLQDVASTDRWKLSLGTRPE